MKRVLIRSFLVAATLALSLAAVAGATESDTTGTDSKSEKKAAPPSFQPGAEVVLAITLKAPKEWALNPEVPLRLMFDEEELKHAPYTVQEATNLFKFELYLPEMTVEVPVKLDEQLSEGRLTIPIKVDCSICDEVSGQCTFASEIVAAKLRVQATAEPGAENQALKQGISRHTQLLSAP